MSIASILELQCCIDTLLAVWRTALMILTSVHVFSVISSNNPNLGASWRFSQSGSQGIMRQPWSSHDRVLSPNTYYAVLTKTSASAVSSCPHGVSASTSSSFSHSPQCNSPLIPIQLFDQVVVTINTQMHVLPLRFLRCSVQDLCAVTGEMEKKARGPSCLSTDRCGRLPFAM